MTSALRHDDIEARSGGKIRSELIKVVDNGDGQLPERLKAEAETIFEKWKTRAEGKGKVAGNGAGKDAGKDAGKEAGKDAGKGAGKEAGKDKSQRATKANAKPR